MTTGAEPPTSGTLPQAILLDHGGVMSTSTKTPDRLRDFTDELHDMVVRLGVESLSADRVYRDVVDGWAAYRSWKQGHVRSPSPPEIGHHQIWTDLIAADWPESARAAVAAHATVLARRLVDSGNQKTRQPGMLELLELTTRSDIRTGIVSNTLCGAALRHHARVWGTDRHLAVQVYSDETGIRKPDPRMLTMAATSLGVSPADCWYVGDNYDRDVLCARRAGIGTAILMRPVGRLDLEDLNQPDVVVGDGVELLEFLQRTIANHSTGADVLPNLKGHP